MEGGDESQGYQVSSGERGGGSGEGCRCIEGGLMIKFECIRYEEKFCLLLLIGDNLPPNFKKVCYSQLVDGSLKTENSQAAILALRLPLLVVSSEHSAEQSFPVYWGLFLNFRKQGKTFLKCTVQYLYFHKILHPLLLSKSRIFLSPQRKPH